MFFLSHLVGAESSLCQNFFRISQDALPKTGLFLPHGAVTFFDCYRNFYPAGLELTELKQMMENHLTKGDGVENPSWIFGLGFHVDSKWLKVALFFVRGVQVPPISLGGFLFSFVDVF